MTEMVVAKDANSKPSCRSPTTYAWLEALVVGMVLAFPLFGTFMPIETYLQPINFAPLSGQTRMEKFDFSHIVFLVVSALAVYLVLVNFRGMLRAARLSPLLILLLALIAASVLWSANPDIALRRVLRLLVFGTFGFYLFVKYDVKEFTRFITRVLAVQAFASFAILILRPDLAFSSLNTYHDAVRGANLEKNSLGEVMSFTVLCSGYSFFAGLNSRKFSFIVLMGSIVLVILSRSTTSRLVVLAIIPIALFCWLARKRNPGWGIVASMIAVVGVASLILIFLNIDDFLKIVGKSTTLTGRTDVWHAVVEAIRQRPFLGYGYAFWTIASTTRNNIWMEVGWSPPHAHSGWLDSMLQLGVVGLLITVALFAVSMSRAARLGLFERKADAVFMGLIIVNLFIRSWTQTVLLEPQESDLIWLVIGYLYLARMSNARRLAELRSRPRLKDHRKDVYDGAQSRYSPI